MIRPDVKLRLIADNGVDPVVFFAGGYDDHYICLPTLRALAVLFGGRLTLVGVAGAIEQVAYGLPLRQLISLPMPCTDEGRAFDAAEVAQRVGACDLLISLNPWINQSFLSLKELLAPELSIGFHETFDIHLARNSTKHVADQAFEIARLFRPGLKLEDFAVPPLYDESAHVSAARICQRLPVDKRLLCIHTDTLPEKMWPEPMWIRFLDRFLAMHPDYCVAVLGMKGIDVSRCQFRQRIMTVCKQPIPVSALVLAEANLFVGVDSVFLHIADLFRVPALGLFGPTPAHQHGLRFGPGQNLSVGSDIGALPPATVLDAVQDIMRGRLRPLYPPSTMGLPHSALGGV